MTRPIDRALGAAAAVLILVGCAAVSSPSPAASARPAPLAGATDDGPAPMATVTATTDTRAAAVAGELVVLLNELRVAEGLAPLQPDRRLEASAAAQVREMMRRGRLFHQELDDELELGWALVGENVGYGPDAATIHRALVDSPSHHANLVDGRFRRVAVVADADAAGRLWVAQVFGG